MHIDNKDRVSICFGNEGGNTKQNSSNNNNKKTKSKQDCKDVHVVDRHLVSIGFEIAQKKKNTNKQSNKATIISSTFT